MSIPTLKIGIVGGGHKTEELMKLLERIEIPWFQIQIAGVCDVNHQAVGYQYAKKKGIFATTDYHNLFHIEGLDALVEMAEDRDLLIKIIKEKPKRMAILDHNIGYLFWDLIHVTENISSTRRELAFTKNLADIIFRGSRDRMLIVGPDFNIIDVNEAFLQAVARKREEVIGSHCYEISHGSPVPCSQSPILKSSCPLEETRQYGHSAFAIHEHLDREGNSQYCEVATYPLKGEKGNLIEVLEIWRDITSEVVDKVQQRAERIKKDLVNLVYEDKMISLGKLVASAVHEINNPIQGILTFCRLMLERLKEDKFNESDRSDFKEYLTLVGEETERCGTIVSGLLSFSKQKKVDSESLDINDLLRDVIQLTHHQMELQNIVIQEKFSKDIRTVKGDRTQIQQCFMNIVFNAIEAMPSGGILTIRTEAHKESLRIEINDTGKGIPDEVLPHIFEPFVTTKEEGSGIGLGLSIVYGIVHQHRGNVQVESQQGKGTTFVLSFPMH